MNKCVGALAVLLLFVSCSGNGRSVEQTIQKSAETEKVSSVPGKEMPANRDRKQSALLESYPDFIKDIRDGKLILTDGTEMVYDDGEEKSFERMLDYSDPEDMFFVRYDSRVSPPEYLSDAGRSRCEELFKKMYGATAAAVSRNLVSVDWFGSKVRITRVNGADKALRAVAEELKQHPELRKYLASSGTFNWRKVRGAKRQSAHSYGIAFDIGVSYSDYWLWKNPGAKETSKLKYANRFPRELVEIFERHGFIWGGAWYHYDTMHFEYRPEILHYSRSGE